MWSFLDKQFLGKKLYLLEIVLKKISQNLAKKLS